MSLIFADSFDHYALVSSARQVRGKWDLTPPSGFANVPGRRGTTGTTGGLRKNIDPKSGLVVGCAIFSGGTSANLNGINPALPEQQRGAFLFDLLNDSIIYLSLGVSSDGRMRVSRGAYPQVRAGEGGLTQGSVGGRESLWTSAPKLFEFGQWNYVEFYAIATGGDSGLVKVALNGATVLEDEFRTIPLAPVVGFPFPGNFTQVALRGDIGASYDDFYIFDTSGSRNNDFIGDVQVDLILPDGPGARANSVIGGTTPAPTRWQGAVSPDDGVTLNRLDASGDDDSFTFEDLPYETAEVYGVQVVALARKSDAGPARLNLTHDVNSETVDATPELLTPSAGNTFSYETAALDTSADGPWTLELVQDSEFGYRREELP